MELPEIAWMRNERRRVEKVYALICCVFDVNRKLGTLDLVSALVRPPQGFRFIYRVDRWSAANCGEPGLLMTMFTVNKV